ncbi:unnamed protein product [Acanthoscelides obtectus]|uniref:Uncharacterized protein n=1 Tax=Acanthoscelides obtectus TaxID=200917 RepID=A0A9P0LFJ5_ACAOB|nr:unnamed protein product [Acanthoscelides obtectus]CAK1663549.1 hypothetical protein AOBTE_LOCUS23722 [Acanthoscelides obtectus]
MGKKTRHVKPYSCESAQFRRKRKPLKESSESGGAASSDVSRNTDELVRLILDCVDQIPALTDQLVQNILGNEADEAIVNDSEEIKNVDFENCSESCVQNIPSQKSKNTKHVEIQSSIQERPRNDGAVDAKNRSTDTMRCALRLVEACCDQCGIDTVLQIPQEVKDEVKAAIARLQNLLNEMSTDVLRAISDCLRQAIASESEYMTDTCNSIEISNAPVSRADRKDNKNDNKKSCMKVTLSLLSGAKTEIVEVTKTSSYDQQSQNKDKRLDDKELQKSETFKQDSSKTYLKKDKSKDKLYSEAGNSRSEVTDSPNNDASQQSVTKKQDFSNRSIWCSKKSKKEEHRSSTSNEKDSKKPIKRSKMKLADSKHELTKSDPDNDYKGNNIKREESVKLKQYHEPQRNEVSCCQIIQQGCKASDVMSRREDDPMSSKSTSLPENKRDKSDYDIHRSSRLSEKDSKKSVNGSKTKLADSKHESRKSDHYNDHKEDKINREENSVKPRDDHRPQQIEGRFCQIIHQGCKGSDVMSRCVDNPKSSRSGSILENKRENTDNDVHRASASDEKDFNKSVKGSKTKLADSKPESTKPYYDNDQKEYKMKREKKCVRPKEDHQTQHNEGCYCYRGNKAPDDMSRCEDSYKLSKSGSHSENIREKKTEKEEYRSSTLNERDSKQSVKGSEPKLADSKDESTKLEHDNNHKEDKIEIEDKSHRNGGSCCRMTHQQCEDDHNSGKPGNHSENKMNNNGYDIYISRTGIYMATSMDLNQKRSGQVQDKIKSDPRGCSSTSMSKRRDSRTQCCSKHQKAHESHTEVYPSRSSKAVTDLTDKNSCDTTRGSRSSLTSSSNQSFTDHSKKRRSVAKHDKKSQTNDCRCFEKKQKSNSRAPTSGHSYTRSSPSTSCKQCCNDKMNRSKSEVSPPQPSTNSCNQKSSNNLSHHRRMSSTSTQPHASESSICPCSHQNAEDTSHCLSELIRRIQALLHERCFRIFFGPSLDESAIAFYETYPLLPTAVSNARVMMRCLLSSDEEEF